MLDKAELGYSWFLTWLSRMCLGNQSKLSQFNIKSYSFLNWRRSAHKLWAKYSFGDRSDTDVISPIPTNTSLHICLPTVWLSGHARAEQATRQMHRHVWLMARIEQTIQPSIAPGQHCWAPLFYTKVWQKLWLKLNVHAITFRVVNCSKKRRKKKNQCFFRKRNLTLKGFHQRSNVYWTDIQRS